MRQSNISPGLLRRKQSARRCNKKGGIITAPRPCNLITKHDSQSPVLINLIASLTPGTVALSRPPPRFQH
jgi:hypothetical protein